ncbi:MAG: hypothetical protein P4K93_07555 [Terracidiphilus sp.]|nr:hypothetical protein [Terracidiphilus sp.]
MSTQSSLFPEPVEVQVHRLDAAIASLLFGGRGGPLNLRLADDEKAVLEMIRYRRGAAKSISLRDIQQRTKLDPRTIKQAVRTLRLNFRLPIGSSKNSESGGYYLMISAEDRAIWRKDVLDQVRAQVDVLRAADGHQAALEALGQLREELLSQTGIEQGARNGAGA